MNDEERQPPIGSALQEVNGPNGAMSKTEWRSGGIESTFFRFSDERSVVLDPAEELQWATVQQFVREVEKSPVPLMLKTTSRLVGFAEKLFLGRNFRIYPELPDNPAVKRDVYASLALCAYALGTGIMIPEGYFGLIGHRDLVIIQDQRGDYIYADQKLPVDHYYPPKAARWSFWKGNLEEFNGAQALQRWLPQQIDPYRVGIDSLLQAVGITWILSKGYARIRTNFLSDEEIHMWQKYGLYKGIMNRELAIRQITADIITHIR